MDALLDAAEVPLIDGGYYVRHRPLAGGAGGRQSRARPLLLPLDGGGGAPDPGAIHAPTDRTVTRRPIRRCGPAFPVVLVVGFTSVPGADVKAAGVPVRDRPVAGRSGTR